MEVIVSDNPQARPARAVFDRWARPRWRYLVNDSLAMHDNFERGCAAAAGEYIAVVIDKTVLHPTALELANRAIDAAPEVEIVTWWNDGYDPVDEAHDLGTGCFQPMAKVVPRTLYEPAAELERHFAHSARRGTNPVLYVRVKIVFGAFSRLLLDRIREQTGRVFYPLAPDYTSMVPACVLGGSAVDLGRPLLVSYNSVRSNGRLQSLDAGHARRFIEAADPAIIDALPIAGLYASHHNVVAYDLVSAASRCPTGTTPPLHLPNLLRRAREDLDGVRWTDPSERAAQYVILEAAETRLGVVPKPERAPPPREHRTIRARLGASIARVPPLERLASRASGGQSLSPSTYASPLDAAFAADDYYTTGRVA